ncbi:hypothetical protein HK405_002287 [Cladochytrium tenue]|nr:hypothetical protein HK405_002287 [Cladochytrium tenue]
MSRTQPLSADARDDDDDRDDARLGGDAARARAPSPTPTTATSASAWFHDAPAAVALHLTAFGWQQRWVLSAPTSNPSAALDSPARYSAHLLLTRHVSIPITFSELVPVDWEQEAEVQRASIKKGWTTEKAVWIAANRGFEQLILSHHLRVTPFIVVYILLSLVLLFSTAVTLLAAFGDWTVGSWLRERRKRRRGERRVGGTEALAPTASAGSRAAQRVPEEQQSLLVRVDDDI